MFNVEENKKELIEKLESDDPKVQAAAMYKYMENVATQLAEEYTAIKDTQDSNILKSRGYRVLTSVEEKAYQKIIDKMRAQESIDADDDVFLPTTVIQTVFDNLVQDHPIFAEIDFQNVTGITEMITRKSATAGAWWGKLTDEVKKELEESFELETVNVNKLSAYLPIAKAYLDLGPTWLDKFVRTVLEESIQLGSEKAIFTGTGNNEPIGMNRDIEGSVSAGVYPEKETVEFNGFEPDILFPMISKLAKTDTGYRKVTKVIFIVNPVDYYAKVLPAITKLNANGNYLQTLPFPITFIQTEFLTEGKAIMGIGKQYFYGVGGNQKGNIIYSDDYKFLEDQRTYLAKLYGQGKPKDNDAFLYLDISNLNTTTETTLSEENDVITYGLEQETIADKISIPAQTKELYGKNVSDMIGTDIKVFEDGSVVGTLNKVTGYTGFSSTTEEQEGYYFPFTLNKSGSKMTFKKNGVISKKNIAWEADNVFRVTKDDTFEVLVDGKSVVTFNFEYATFEE